MNALLRTAPAGAWVGDATIFTGTFSTCPAREIVRASWDTITEIIAPRAGPTVTADKARAPYVLPCALKVAPLVGKTLERAIEAGQPTTGKQRSAGHVTEATWMLIDLDGVEPALFKHAGQTLKRAGVAWAAWTSHSIGTKPGLRGRFAIPLDRALCAVDYARVWSGANALIFGGKADPSAAKLCQQQGAWAVHPQRATLARRWVHSGGIASADALMQAAPNAPAMANPSPSPNTARALTGASFVDVAQLAAAVRLFDADAYADWDRVGSLLAAIAMGKPEHLRAQVLQVAKDFSASADPEAQASNDAPQYSLEARFTSWRPSVTSDIAAATLFGEARDRGVRVVRKALEKGDWEGTGAAWKYVAAYHKKAWAQVNNEGQEE